MTLTLCDSVSLSICLSRCLDLSLTRTNTHFLSLSSSLTTPLAYVCAAEPAPSRTTAAATWCGADVDARGNERFGGTRRAPVAGERAGVLAAHGFPRGLSRARFAGRALFTDELQFGLTNFDSFGKSVLVVIQARASPRRARGGGVPRPPSE